VRSLLENYLGANAKPHEPTVTLLNVGDVPWDLYFPPQYPPLTKMAGIQGKVAFEIDVDNSNGELRQVRVFSGHPLLQKAVREAAKGWKLKPSQLTQGKRFLGVFDFSFNCPARPSK
jgi:TonB family protein